MAYFFLVYIRDEKSNEFLFNSDISFYGRGQGDHVYGQGKQIVYNQSVVNIINHLKSK